MHSWGDEDFKHFNDVAEAAYEIGDFCRRYGRISVTQTKEKWGTVRVYCMFGIYTFHDFTHPGRMHSRYPKWLWHLNCNVSFSKPGGLFFEILNRFLIIPYQRRIYREAYRRALRKYPHIREEILSCPDWSECLEGL